MINLSKHKINQNYCRLAIYQKPKQIHRNNCRLAIYQKRKHETKENRNYCYSRIVIYQKPKMNQNYGYFVLQNWQIKPTNKRHENYPNKWKAWKIIQQINAIKSIQQIYPRKIIQQIMPWELVQQIKPIDNNPTNEAINPPNKSHEN